MQSVFIELTKYIFAFLMAFYVLSAYRGAIIHKEEKRKGIYIQQYIIIFAIHFLGYYVLYLMKGETRYIGFYFVQLIYLIVFIAFYYILYPKASRLLVNNMCMLMSVGFIMIARLNFDKCVKQFVIAVLGTVIMFLVPWLIKSVKSFRNFGWIYCISGLVLSLLCRIICGRLPERGSYGVRSVRGRACGFEYRLHGTVLSIRAQLYSGFHQTINLPVQNLRRLFLRGQNSPFQ